MYVPLNGYETKEKENKDGGKDKMKRSISQGARMLADWTHE